MEERNAKLSRILEHPPPLCALAIVWATSRHIPLVYARPLGNTELFKRNKTTISVAVVNDTLAKTHSRSVAMPCL